MRYAITFFGTVQGVGFRYTTVNVASHHQVTGWVRNEPDGSVLCIAEGDQSELDRFVAAVQNAMHGNIRETRIDKSPATGEFTDFHIQR